ncbi:MAG TPA: GNAT family N-acetyltransferase [Stellaceae bacterium]|nr:GNAT family N-acetyltransferase [Stellaceae bacterium]
MSDRLTIAASPLPPLAELASLWRTFDAQSDMSFFVAWPWIGVWLELLPPALAPQLLRLEQDGVCRGAAIAVRHDSRRHGFVAAHGLFLNATGDRDLDCLTIEHNGFAGCGIDRGEAWRALVEWFGASAISVDEFDLPGVTDIIALEPLGSVQHRHGYRVDLAQIRNGNGKIGAILSANARQQLNSAMRALAAEGPIALDSARGADEALAFFDDLKQFHIRSWTRRGRRHAFESPFFERFHRALIARGAEAGDVELLRLRAGGTAFGYLYNFRRNGHVYAYQSGFDDTNSRLRPGYVAHALAIERYGGTGATVYDFMAGSNRLKESFATERYDMYWYTLRRPLLRFRAEQVARAAKERLLSPLRARSGRPL